MGTDRTAEALQSVRRRAARELFINGILSREEWELVDRSLTPPTLGQRVVAKLPWVGYAAIGLTALIEIAAQVRPDLRGPLEQLGQAINALAGGL